MKLALAILLILTVLALCAEQGASTRGACGGNLLELYTRLCGRDFNSKLRSLRFRYPRLYRRAMMRLMRSRSRRSVDLVDRATIEQRLSEPLTRRIIRTVNGDTSFQVERARLRRSISYECCQNTCSEEHIRRNYCHRAKQIFN